MHFHLSAAAAQRIVSSMHTNAYHSVQGVKAHPAVGFWGASLQKCARGVSRGSAAALPRTSTLATPDERLAPPWRSHPHAQLFLEELSGDHETNICPSPRSAHRAARRVFTLSSPASPSVRRAAILPVHASRAPFHLHNWCVTPCAVLCERPRVHAQPLSAVRGGCLTLAAWCVCAAN